MTSDNGEMILMPIRNMLHNNLCRIEFVVFFSFAGSKPRNIEKKQKKKTETRYQHRFDASGGHSLSEICRKDTGAVPKYKMNPDYRKWL